MNSEKLQKVLAREGLASRRELERWIQDGRITVNGQVAKLGCRVTPKDQIKVDDKFIRQTEIEREVIMYNKPEGELVTRSDPEGRLTVFENLPRLKDGRWIAIGRLDINTSGLILFTNDGELANQLMHPSSEIVREYAVRILGNVDADMIRALKKGVKLEDGYAKFHSVKEAGGEGANRWFHVTVKEGRNRLVRRLWESQGVIVSRLIRVRFGDVVLPRDLRAGEYRKCNDIKL